MSTLLNKRRDEDHLARPVSSHSYYDQDCKTCGFPIHFGMVSKKWAHGYHYQGLPEHPDALLVGKNGDTRHYSIAGCSTTSLCRTLRDGVIEEDAYLHSHICQRCVRKILI